METEEELLGQKESQETILKLHNLGSDFAASEWLHQNSVSVLSYIKEVWRQAAHHHQSLRIFYLLLC